MRKRTNLGTSSENHAQFCVEATQQKDGQVKARFKDEQIIAMIKNRKLARRPRMYAVARYCLLNVRKCLSKYRGLAPLDAKRLCALEVENGN